MSPIVLPLRPLSAEVFAPFGEVIEPAAARRVFEVNDGTARRFHDLARIDTGSDGGHPVLSLFRASPREMPFEIAMLERHPLGSQAFVPLAGARFIVVVAESPETQPLAFLAQNGQGVNYRRGAWHHPLVALDRESDFLVIDRGGEGRNCDEVALAQRCCVEAFGQ
ncbi:MAG TPA: ureidoglycolate lyase [Xanthomonadaceae bacterium]|nr:ureidoglycolate lyase [Xanthomonadaceae bacterium]